MAAIGIDLILSTFSHEVRTPLTAMTGALNLLVEGSLGEVADEQRGFIDLALRNARRLESLIAAILESGRVAGGDWPVDPIPARIDRLVRAGIEEATDPVAGGAARVTFESEYEGLVPADGEAVRRVIKNLVANALRFTPPGGPVRVEMGHDDDGVWIEVCDQGPGVPEESREAIFERFRQLPTAAGGRPSGGLGLGLYLARTIATAHGGTLQCVEPIDGQGACFRLVLPFQVASRPTPSSPMRMLRIARADGAPMRTADTFRAAEVLRTNVPAARRYERPDALVALLPDRPLEELEQLRATIGEALGDSLRVYVGRSARNEAA